MAQTSEMKLMTELRGLRGHPGAPCHVRLSRYRWFHGSCILYSIEFSRFKGIQI